MKKIFRNLMAIAIAGIAFTACEDVPAPYDVFAEEEVVEAAGSGTIADPFNVKAAIAKCKEIGATESTEKYYVKGIASSTATADATYGNATFDIVDEEGGDPFKCFQVAGTDGKKMPAGFTINKGDEVVVYGPIYNYNGKTPETAGKGAAYIVSINGKSTDDAGSGDNTDVEAKAVTIAEFNAAAESSDVWYQLTGTVKNLKDGDQYGNFDLEDETGSVYVYGLLSEKGGAKKLFQELVAAKGIKNGSKLTIIGNRGSYNGKIEVMNAYFVKVEEGSGETPVVGGNGDGTANAPYDVTAAMSAGTGTGVYVKGFIVGSVSGQVLASGANFSASSDVATNILIAASADETNVANCMPVQLPTGAIRSAINLVDNAGNYKKEVTLYGNIEKYFGATGLKTVTFAILDGNEIGTNPSGSTTPTPSTDAQKVTIAEFNAAAESNDVWYQLTGTVKNLKDGDQYGNFDLEDETGSVYVYGLLSEKGGAKKLFQELVAAKGIKEGSKITIIGNRGSYNGKIEVMNAYFVSIDDGTSSTPSDGVQTISVADFNAAAESTDVWYKLTGTISNLKDGDQYGNFDLTDATGSVYVYGVLSEKGGAKKLFQELVAAHGIKNGTTITIIGNRGSYNGKIEVMNAYFVSASN